MCTVLTLSTPKWFYGQNVTNGTSHVSKLTPEIQNTTSPDVEGIHHMMLNGDLQALLQMYILKEEHQTHIMNMYQRPVGFYKSHLIPLALSRAIHFTFKH